VSATADRLDGQQVLLPDYEDVRVRRGPAAGTNTLLAAHELAAERSANGGFDGDHI
jgi:hypothetical protein